jgi:hypothetical protein
MEETGACAARSLPSYAARCLIIKDGERTQTYRIAKYLVLQQFAETLHPKNKVDGF